MKALNIQWERKGVARALIAIRRLKQAQGQAHTGFRSPVARALIAIRRLKRHLMFHQARQGHRSEGSYRDQAFEASMLIRKAIAKSVSRDVIAVRRLKHPEAPYHKKASLWIFEDPERGLLVIGRALLESSLF